MAITKERKSEILEQQKAFMERSTGVFFTEYIGLTNKDLESLRLKVREAGGELHVVKNTLARKALQDLGVDVREDVFEKSTAISFAFRDAVEMAKTLRDFAKTSEFVKLKAGLLGKNMFDGKGVERLADLPPLPVVRAQLLGVLQAPASKLVRTLAEPGRSLATVVKAYADKDSAAAAA